MGAGYVSLLLLVLFISEGNKLMKKRRVLVIFKGILCRK